MRDAINNVLEVVKNGEHCLIYDRPLAEHGLSWRELVVWWSAVEPTTPAEERASALALYERLLLSLGGNGAEELVFKTYCKRFGTGGFHLPALLPQVYLHYDPYSQRRLAERPGPLRRQRMDFLLLLPQRVRVVLEVDGIQHYASGRQADPKRYADMVSEDRSLRLAGYEVYRFGGQELLDKSAGTEMLERFFDSLFERHQVALTPPQSA